MSTRPLIRKASAADLDQLYEIDRICFSKDDPDRQAAGEGDLERGVADGRLLVLVEMGSISGYLQYEQPSTACVYLRTLAVLPGRRGRRADGRHVAGELLEHYLALAICQEPAVLTAVTSPRNFPMVRLLLSECFFGRAVLPDHLGPGKDRILFRRLSHVRDEPSYEVAFERGDHLVERLDRVHHEGGSAFRRNLLSSLRGPGETERPAYVLTEIAADRLPSGGKRNEEWPWDEFDSQAYFERNYTAIHPCDGPIVDNVTKFFASVITGDHHKALDVGTGPNLYPPLLMLPFSHDITAWEYSPPNSMWLRAQREELDPAWQAFWARMCTYEPYQKDADIQSSLRKCLQVKSLSVYELPPRMWDLGTMFFVAESISPSQQDFRDAVDQFLSALKPGAPFATAFMERSTGYSVGSKHYPAYTVDGDEIRSYLAQRTTGLRTEFIDHDKTLRSGYNGMVLAMGHRAPDPQSVPA
jgi:hypothetical protein